MASLLNTINFLIAYLWATSKYQIFSVFATCCIYFLKYDYSFMKIISVNILVMNLVFINSIFNKDKYLISNGFYKFFNISTLNILISKSLLVYCLLAIHFTFLLLLPFKTSVLICLVLNVVMMIVFIITIVFNKVIWKLVSSCILILIISICFISNNISNLLTFTTLLLITGFLLLYKTYYNYKASIE